MMPTKIFEKWNAVVGGRIKKPKAYELDLSEFLIHYFSKPFFFSFFLCEYGFYSDMHSLSATSSPTWPRTLRFCTTVAN